MISPTQIPPLAEQSRARYPDDTGFVERDGIRTFWERYGDGTPTLLLVPPWSIVHSRCWKAQIPYLARHFRVVAFDGRGNGRSDRSNDPLAYAEAAYAADALAVLDATGTDRAVLVSLSLGAQRSLILASEHADRVAASVFISPAVPLLPRTPEREETAAAFEEERDESEGWWKYNAAYWRRDYRGFLEFFFSQVFTEPHSTKQIEDAVGWGLATDPETLIATEHGPALSAEETRDMAVRTRQPSLVIHGDEDAIVPHAIGAELARLTGGALVTLAGSGHCPQARDPAKVNRIIRDFVCSLSPRMPTPAWTRGRGRPKRALYLSSPIGLGHTWRDVAIAEELRRQHPDLEIDWLAQDPVTRVLEARGERIHPASAELASESAHIVSESGDHDLHAFQAIRRMDEILVSNFMVFHDVVEAQAYDVWIADEGWEIDYYLHENPELKTAAYCWLTDFVGWIPTPDGGDHEAFLTADLNAEMIEHIARFPRVRDRAIFIGGADDVVPGRFGPELPEIHRWTERHYDFSGYITGFDPDGLGDRERLRAELGYRPNEQVCIVTVGGSGVGHSLLRRTIDAFAEARRLVPELRMIAVAGPRIDPATLPQREGLEVRPYVHELRRHLAACDLAVVQAGLATTMELTAAKRPFLYFPLKHHFEQNFHVRHRLDRYGAGRCMDFDASSPGVIAAAIAEEIGKEVVYRDVETDGAARAAALIAELL